MFRLLALPNDIILPIVEAVEGRGDLIALAQTCKTLQATAEAQLFKSIWIHNGALAQALSVVLRARPERFGYVQKLEVTPGSSHWEGIQVMPSLVRQMNNLRSLQVESPLINSFRYDRWWEETCVVDYMRSFQEDENRDRALRNLRSFTFHSHGIDDRYYHVQNILPAFSSRFLKHVHISCVHIDQLQIPASDVGKSAIESLVLDECNINATALAALLTLPRNLKSLSLEESSHHGDHMIATCPPLNEDIPALLSALSKQQHSLEYLKHTCRYNMTSSDSIDTDQQDLTGFANFNSLKALICSHRSALTHVLRIPHLAPPNLETFRLTDLRVDSSPFWKDLPDQISAIALATPFKYLELHFEPRRAPWGDAGGIASSFMPAGVAQAEGIVKIAHMMKEKEATTRVIGNIKYNCIPPYLYADERVDDRGRKIDGRPGWHVVFESERFWVEEEEYRREVPAGEVVLNSRPRGGERWEVRLARMGQGGSWTICDR